MIIMYHIIYIVTLHDVIRKYDMVYHHERYVTCMTCHILVDHNVVCQTILSPIRTPFPSRHTACRSRIRPSLDAAGGNHDDRKAKAEKQRKEKEKLAKLMAKQEEQAVKKYLEAQAKKDAESQAKIRQAQAHMATRGKSKGKDAPWSSENKDGKGDRQPQPPKKKKPGFQQITLTCRQFSIDDIQDVTFEGSHLTDVPFLGLPEVAVFGRSNVGKSSMLNCLTGANKKVAVVSKTPGRTQQINLFKVCIYTEDVLHV